MCTNCQVEEIYSKGKCKKCYQKEYQAINKMNIKKIFLIGGHGKKGTKNDPGAVAADGTTERSIIESVSKKLLDKFIDSGLGSIVVEAGVLERMTITQKVKVVNDVCKKENLKWTDAISISLHCDWRGANEGVGAYFYDGSEESEDFARAVGNVVARVGDRKLLWVKSEAKSNYGRLGEVHDPIPLSMLLEMGSLRADANQNDGLELLKSQEGQDLIATAIFEGLLAFADIDVQKQEKTPETPKKEASNTIQEMLERIVLNQKTIWKNAKGNGTIQADASDSASLVRIIQKEIGLPVSE